MVFIFWALVLALLYSYFVFPVLLVFLSFFFPEKPGTTDGAPLKVSIIIAAYNEEEFIQRKLQNIFETDYPHDRVEVIVVSDASTDQTATRARAFENVQMIELQKRSGKTECQNIACGQANGDILLFTDVNAMFEPATLDQIVRPFHDPAVGCVSGKLDYQVRTGEISAVEKSYWEFETLLKKAESRLGILVGANGALYAVRKSCYQPLDPLLVSDFIQPVQVRAQGYRVLFEADARCTEPMCLNIRESFVIKRRIISRAIYTLFKYRYVLNPARFGFFAIALISHKFLRWCGPLMMVGIFAANLFLLKGFYLLFFLGQMVFYAAGLRGIARARRGSPPRGLAVPAYVLTVQGAALVGLLDVPRGRLKPYWVPKR